MRFAVNYKDKNASNTVAEFDTLDKAKAYIGEETRCHQRSGLSFDHDDRADQFQYEVFDTCGNIEDGPVYTSDVYYAD